MTQSERTSPSSCYSEHIRQPMPGWGLIACALACSVVGCNVTSGSRPGGDGDGDAATSGGGSFLPGDGDGAVSGGGPGSGGGSPLPGSGGGVIVGDGDGDAPPAGLPKPVVEVDEVSPGGTITFQNIGAPGWYPSRRDPASGMCDAVESGECCMTEHHLNDDALSPWNEELIMQLRGPLLLERYAVYQPVEGGNWARTGIWDKGGAVATQGVTFGADGVVGAGIDGTFAGGVGSTCVIDVMSDQTFPCGPMSSPYCPGEPKQMGWSGSKLFVLLARSPRRDSPEASGLGHCDVAGDGWFDAPWIGLSHGELVRSGKFGGCHCYAKDPAEWWLADGCGQFNVFEVVNDNNEYANLDLFSTNLFAYHGYVGEGPCGQNCDVSGLPSNVDLVNKSNSQPATTGATATPDGGPGFAFRRPADGYRYFVILLDVDSRSIQMGLIHPEGIPPSVGGLLPGLPEWVSPSTVQNVIALRLPG